MGSAFKAAAAVTSVLAMAVLTTAERTLYTDYSNFTSCQENNQFNASTFAVSLTPDNNTLAFDLAGTLTYEGALSFAFIFTSDGTQIFRTAIDPCSVGIPELCPGMAGQLALNSNQDISSQMLDQIPNDVYTTPDLEAFVRLYMNDTATNQTFACIEGKLMNGVTATSDNATTSDNSTMSGGDSSNAGNGTDAGATDESSGRMLSSTWSLPILAVLVVPIIVGFS